MKKSTLITVVAGLLLLGAITYIIIKRGGESKPTLTPIEQVRQDDIHRLETQGDEQEKAKSLKRMAFQDPDRAMIFTRQLVSNPSPILRAAAYETVGSFSGEAWDKLVQDGLKDTEQSVRIATLKGLNRQPGQRRSELVQEYLKQSQRDPLELTWAHMVLMRSASDVAQKQTHEKSILTELSKVNDQSRDELLLDLYKIWPGRAEIVTYAQKVLSSGRETQALMPSFRYLESFAPESLASTLKSAKWPESRSFILSVIEFVSESCPKEARALLKMVESHSRADDEVKNKLQSFTESGACDGN